MDRTVKVWDAASGQVLLTLNGHRQPVLCVAVSADGSRIVSGAYEGELKVWDAHSGRPLLTLRAAGGSPDTKVTVWDRARGRNLLTPGHPGRIRWVAMSTDGRRIFSASEEGILRTWDAVSGQPRLP